MTRRRRWFVAILAVVLVLGVATPVALVLLPCKSHAVALLNATRWPAQVTLQIVTSETGPRYTVWSGTVDTFVPPLRIPVGGLRLEGHYSMTVHFPETGQTIPEFQFGYITPYLLGVEFLLIRDEDIIYTTWNDPPLTKQPASVWEAASHLLAHVSCLDG